MTDAASIAIGHAAALSGVPASVISTATTIDELGLDSLACIELVALFEDSTGAEIGCVERIDLRTIGDLVRLAEGRDAAVAA